MAGTMAPWSSKLTVSCKTHKVTFVRQSAQRQPHSVQPDAVTLHAPTAHYNAWGQRTPHKTVGKRMTGFSLTQASYPEKEATPTLILQKHLQMLSKIEQNPLFNFYYYYFLLTLHSTWAVPQPGSNLCSLQWKQGVVTTGPPGRPLNPFKRKTEL